MKALLLMTLCSVSLSSLAQEDLHSLAQLKKEQRATSLLKLVQVKTAFLNPQLAAVSALNPAAEKEAAHADQVASDLPLYGLPILVKDNIAIKGMATTAGSLALADNVATEDAFVVTKLRAAGMILAGKTNLSEWANFRSSKSSSGWSSAGGQTRNPYHPNMSPCGSSSGSGAAVAARMIPAAIGTETDGSIVCPAAVNGVVGFKPTLGLVSRAGIVPLSHSQDTAGPMTLTVRDAALLMNVISGSDPQDPATQEADIRRSDDYTAGLQLDALKGKRLGVVAPLTQSYDAATRTLFRRSIALLKAQGAIIVENLPFPTLDKLGEDEYQVLLADFKSDLNQYLSATPSAVKTRSLEQLIAFNQTHAKQIMPYFGQEIMLLAQKAKGLDDPNYLAARQRVQQRAGEQGIDALLRAHQLDALIAPTTGVAWPINYKKGDLVSGSASSPAAIAGYPHLTVPMGLVRGLPVGLSFFARAWSDAQLLNMGYAFEQARPALPAPKLLKKAAH